MPTTEQFLQALTESTETLYNSDTDYTPRCVTVVNSTEWDLLPDELREAFHDALASWAQENAPGTWASIQPDGGLFLARAATPEERADDLLALDTIDVRLEDGLSYEKRLFIGDEPGCSAGRHYDDLGGRYDSDDGLCVARGVTLREALIAAFALPQDAGAFVRLPDGGEVDV